MWERYRLGYASSPWYAADRASVAKTRLAAFAAALNFAPVASASAMALPFGPRFNTQGFGLSCSKPRHSARFQHIHRRERLLQLCAPDLWGHYDPLARCQSPPGNFRLDSLRIP